MVYLVTALVPGTNVAVGERLKAVNKIMVKQSAIIFVLFISTTCINF